MPTEPPLYHLTLLRHAQSVGNASGYHQGQAEFPLTERGRAQAQALAQYWQTQGTTFDLCLASPQMRARQTAETVAAALGLPIEYDPLWMERDNGLLAGLHESEARQRYPEPDFISLYEPIGQTGETEWELYLRGGRAIQNILHRPPARYLIVSHGAILNQALKAMLGINPQANFQGVRFRYRNTAFATFTYQPQKHLWVVESLNQRPHWPEEDY